MSIALFVSCGKADSGRTAGTASTVVSGLQARDVVLELIEENRLRIHWTAPEEAEHVDYYLVELRSKNAVITRRTSVKKTELEIAVPSGSYRAIVATVVEGIVVPGAVWNQVLNVETKAVAPDDVKMTVVGLNTAMTSVEHASIGVKWRDSIEFGKIHSGADAELMAYILYWRKGTEAGTIDYEGTTTMKRDIATGVLAKNFVIEELLPGIDYAVRIVAENAAGLRSEGVELTIKTAVSLATAPSPPLIQMPSIMSVGTASDATLSFSWVAPSGYGTDYTGKSAVIKKYRIYWEEGDSVSEATGELQILSKDSTSTSITGLKNETEYTFMVVAVGSGELSTASKAQTYTTAVKTLAEAPTPVSTISRFCRSFCNVFHDAHV